MLERVPWEMRRHDFIPYADTMVKPRYEPIKAANGSEAELYRASVANRNRETQPPLVPHFELGNWRMIDEHLYHLRQIPVDALYPTESDQYGTLVDKYATWMCDGHVPPPISVDERRGQFAILNGHHRYRAAQRVGKNVIRAWVGYNLVKSYKAGKLTTPLTYIGSVLLALRNALPVDPDVIRDALGPDMLVALVALPMTIELNEQTRSIWMQHNKLELAGLVVRQRLQDTHDYHVRPSHDATLILNTLGI